MKILVVSQYYYPEQFRINDVCKELVKRGHEVTVLTGRPNYPEGEIYPGYEKGFRDNEIVNGVHIIRCNCRERHKGIVNLARNYLSFIIQAEKVLNKFKEKYDSIYVYEVSPVTMALPAIKYGRKTNTPVYLYCMDIWPESVRELSEDRLIGTSHPIYIAAKILSKYIYRSCDMIGVKCRQFSDYLEQVCGIDKSKMALLYEHAEESYLSVQEDPEDNGCYDFMFLGNIGYAQKCDLLLKAVKKVKSDLPYKLHFVGDGSALASLKKQTAEMGLEDIVIFHGRKPITEINQFYNMADCCLLTLSSKTACGLTPPGKLIGYMAACRPIIAAAEGATKDILEQGNCGICVENQDIEALTSAMQYALEHQEEFKQKAKNGRKYFMENFTLDFHISQLEKQLNDMVARKIK